MPKTSQMTEEEILKEEHDHGECGTFCFWCIEDQKRFEGRYPLAPGFYASRYMTVGFKA